MLADRPHEELSHVPVNSTPGTGARVVAAVVLLAVLLTVGFLYRHHRNASAEMALKSDTLASADAPEPVDVVKVALASPIHELTLPGEARAWYQSTIYARVSGYIGTLKADIGDKVKKGQVLALIDTPELDDQLNAARAKVAADQSEVTVAEANEAFAESTYKRWNESGKGVVSDQEREEKRAEYHSSVAHLKAVKSHVDLDQAEVKRLTDLTNFKAVEAPYDGVITSRRVDIGDLVTAGSTSGNTTLFDIVRSDTIRIFTDVPQSASNEIAVGMPVTASAREFPDRTFRGTVARTSNSLDPSSNTLTVEADVPNADLTLMPGMYVQVSFQTREAHPSVQIPASAINFRTGGPQVAVVGPGGAVQFHNVTISRDMGDVIELRSGVSPGDRVALNISNQIANGDKVQPVEEDNASTGPVPAKAPAVASRGG
jgi:RND family efflux transporter MFP subunit